MTSNGWSPTGIRLWSIGVVHEREAAERGGRFSIEGNERRQCLGAIGTTQSGDLPAEARHVGKENTEARTETSEMQANRLLNEIAKELNSEEMLQAPQQNVQKLGTLRFDPGIVLIAR